MSYVNKSMNEKSTYIGEDSFGLYYEELSESLARMTITSIRAKGFVRYVDELLLQDKSLIPLVKKQKYMNEYCRSWIHYFLSSPKHQSNIITIQEIDLDPYIFRGGISSLPSTTSSPSAKEMLIKRSLSSEPPPRKSLKCNYETNKSPMPSPFRRTRSFDSLSSSSSSLNRTPRKKVKWADQIETNLIRESEYFADIDESVGYMDDDDERKGFKLRQISEIQRDLDEMYVSPSFSLPSQTSVSPINIANDVVYGGDVRKRKYSPKKSAVDPSIGESTLFYNLGLTSTYPGFEVGVVLPLLQKTMAIKKKATSAKRQTTAIAHPPNFDDFDFDGLMANETTDNNNTIVAKEHLAQQIDLTQKDISKKHFGCDNNDDTANNFGFKNYEYVIHRNPIKTRFNTSNCVIPKTYRRVGNVTLYDTSVVRLQKYIETVHALIIWFEPTFPVFTHDNDMNVSESMVGEDEIVMVETTIAQPNRTKRRKREFISVNLWCDTSETTDQVENIINDIYATLWTNGSIVQNPQNPSTYVCECPIIWSGSLGVLGANANSLLRKWKPMLGVTQMQISPTNTHKNDYVVWSDKLCQKHTMILITNFDKGRDSVLSTESDHLVSVFESKLSLLECVEPHVPNDSYLENVRHVWKTMMTELIHSQPTTKCICCDARSTQYQLCLRSPAIMQRGPTLKCVLEWKKTMI